MALTADHYSVAEDPSWLEILKRRHRLFKIQANQFLTANVDTWSQSQAHQSSLRNILAVNVVNDSAEREVKLSSDFLAAAHSVKHYHNVLQVVEQDRKKRLPILKGHWTSVTSSPTFSQKSWDFYTIRSVGMGNDCMLTLMF